MHISRRAFLGGAIGLAAVAGADGLAQTPLSVPLVDRLEVLFLIDGATFALADPVRRSDLLVEPGRRSDYRRAFAAEWGLSLAVRSLRGEEERNVLIDFGYTPQTFANNAELLGVDPGRFDALVLSHGHYDHFGGLDALLQDGRLRRGTRLRVGGEEAFCQRQSMIGGNFPDFGALDRAALRTAGVEVEIEPRPRLVGGHGFTTGRIPFVSEERPIVPTRMLPGRNCARDQLDPAKRGLEHVQDDAAHELGTAFHLRDRGLVVIGSCSHRGILNTIRQAQAASGIARIHAIIGGFHLVRPQAAAQAHATAQAMAAMRPDYVVPGHCSGEAFIAAANEAMPGKVIRPYVGSRFIFAMQA